MARSLHSVLYLVMLIAAPHAISAARGTLYADCILQIKGAQRTGTTITVMPGGSPAYVLSPTTNRFMLELPLDETYLITFEHPDRVTKQLYFDTTVPVEHHAADFDFPLKVVLEHERNDFTYAGPVGYIHYEHSITDFSYETDYTVKMNGSFLERMEVLHRTGADPMGVPEPLASPERAHPPVVEDPGPIEPGTTLAPVLSRVPPRVQRPVIEPVEPHIPQGSLEEIVVEPVVSDARKLPEPKTPVHHIPRNVPTARPQPLPEEDPAPVRANVQREEEQFVESSRVTTIVRYRWDHGRTLEFRRVVHHYGAVFYFQDGQSIPEHRYADGVDNEPQL